MGRSLTFRVIAGLGQRLAVGQHGEAGHCNSHHTPFFACFILEKKNIRNIIKWIISNDETRVLKQKDKATIMSSI